MHDGNVPKKCDVPTSKAKGGALEVIIEEEQEEEKDKSKEAEDELQDLPGNVLGSPMGLGRNQCCHAPS